MYVYIYIYIWPRAASLGQSCSRATGSPPGGLRRSASLDGPGAPDAQKCPKRVSAGSPPRLFVKPGGGLRTPRC